MSEVRVLAGELNLKDALLGILQIHVSCEVMENLVRSTEVERPNPPKAGEGVVERSDRAFARESL